MIYIGAKYAMSFFDNNGNHEWIPNFTYEPLTIVSYNNILYVSKTFVSNGELPTDTTKWAIITAVSAGV